MSIVHAPQTTSGPHALLHRRDMRGRFENVDVLASLQTSDIKIPAGFFPWLDFPAAVGMAGFFGLKWFFDRRDRMVKESTSASCR